MKFAGNPAAHDAADNPFVHTYHPDHDNRDAQFSPAALPAGIESYTVTRNITLAMAADGSALGVDDLAWGSTTLGGTYRETLSGLRSHDVGVAGTFVLYRVTDIPELTD